MSLQRLSRLFLIFFFSSGILSAQTVLHPGDIIVFSMYSNMGLCGLPPQSDLFSFACFQDIETGTTLDITDNGWETQFPNFWGDGEGTISMSRTGGVIPAGTVITVECRLTAGNWTYRTISPDNGWAIADVNIPGGGFNIDDGGDQLYFMQGGTWDNQGGGGNRALYDGTIIFAANNHATWTANGTTHESNLHPDVTPCYYSQPSSGLTYMDFMEYAGPVDPANHFDWLERIQGPQFWNTYETCADMNQAQPDWLNTSIPIIEDMALRCPFGCNVCPPSDYTMSLYLPEDGLYNVVITNGTDTFTVANAENFDPVVVNVTDTVSYWIVSVEEVGGCTVYSNFYAQADITAPYNNPGTHTEIWICPTTNQVFPLFPLMEGNPEPGGDWNPMLVPAPFGDLYYSVWGPGTYTYFFDHGHDCPPDTASMTIHFIDAAATTFEISCSQNGTPNNIFDDQTVITLNVDGDHFGDTYSVSVSPGTITPNTGTTIVPTDFTLGSGSANGPNAIVTVQSLDAPFCIFQFPITSPGFCSDPCDYNMTASISGIEDICLKNCPENPGSIFIDIEGGTGPYTMDFELTAPNHPTWTFTGINVSPGQEIQVCMDTIAAPFYNASTGYLTLPALLVGSDITMTLLNVFDKYNCISLLDVEELFINIHALPVVTSTMIILCRDEALHVNLTEYDNQVSPFYDVTWYDGDPFGGGERITGPTAVNLTNVVSLWALVEDDYCANAIKIPFTILPQPKLDSIPPIAICQGSIIILDSIALNDAGLSMATYTFHAGLPPDTSNILDPTFYIPADSTTIYVLATAGMCYDTLPIQIFVEDYPDFTLEAQPCDLIQGTYSVLFTSSADSIHASAGVVTNNPSGQDAVTGIPNNTNITIEILNPTGLCKDTFLIIAPNCNCPQINSPIPSASAYQLCEDQTLPVLSVTVDPGLQANWYTVPSGGTAFLQNSLTFQAVVPADAIYYVEAIDINTACYSIRTPISLEVFPLAVLQNVPDPVICDEETIDLSLLVPSVLNAIPGTGSWFDLITHQPASGVQQPQNGEAWYYLFTTTAGSCESSDTIVVTANPLPAIDVFNILCDDILLTYEISFTSDADVVLSSLGTLVQIAGTDSFSIQSIPYDTDVQIDLQYLATGCSASILQVAPNCSCPALLQTSSFQACSDQGNIDLSAFEGPGVTGTWQMVTTPPGVNPATINGSTFQGVNKDPGTYTLRFIRSVILADCVDTASFQIQLSGSPFANAGTNATVCAPDIITLSGTGGGSNVQFNWQTTGTGTIANPNNLSTTYTPTLADITVGTLNFTLTAFDQTGFCPSANDVVTITIDGSAYYILNPGTQTYCDTADIIVDLDALISFGTTSGEWFFPDTVSAPITGSSQINPSTIPAGNYTIFYTSSNAVAPCEDDTTGVNLIIRNCACPNVTISNPTQGLCSQSDALNLNTLLLTGEPGTWSIASAPPGAQPAIINGSQFVTNNSDDGTYRIRFTLTIPVAGCPDFSEVDVIVVESPVLNVLSKKCADDLQSWEVVISSSSTTVVNNIGTLVSLGNNQYRIENIALNTHVQISASTGAGLCTANLDIPNPDCACTISISNLPDAVALCPNETIVLQAEVNDPKGAVTSFWIVSNDSLYQNSIEVGDAGTYEFVASDELECKEQHQVIVTVYTEMVPSVSWLDITCPGDKNGEIILQGITGGNAPYFISINGGSVQQVTAFPYIINNLGAGNYEVEIVDGVNCSITFDIAILSASSESLTLGPDETILAGDSIQINPLLSFLPDTFYWAGDNDQLLDANQLSQWIKPENDQLLQLFGIDEKGCVYSDDLKIKVLLKSSIYVPTIFSPNGDGVNDLLFPMTDPSITLIQYFEIYSRWGELIYSVKDKEPNQDNIGWDGTMKNENLLPGVFVYRLGAINKRGREYTRHGDVTLIR